LDGPGASNFLITRGKDQAPRGPVLNEGGFFLPPGFVASTTLMPRKRERLDHASLESVVAVLEGRYLQKLIVVFGSRRRQQSSVCSL